MDDKKSNNSIDSNEIQSNPVEIDSSTCESTPQSKAGVSQQPSQPDDIAAEECVSSTIDTVNDKQAADIVLTQSSIGDEFTLQLISSEDENEDEKLNGAIKDKDAQKKKPETLFSDIESSDDSIAYEAGKKTDDTNNSEVKASISDVLDSKQSKEQKDKQPEFDTVDSDDDFFEDAPLFDEKEIVSKETLSAEGKDQEKTESSKVTDAKVSEDNEVHFDIDKVVDIETSQSKKPNNELMKDDSIELETNNDQESPEIELTATEEDGPKTNAPSTSPLLDVPSENPHKSSETETGKVDEDDAKMKVNSPKPPDKSPLHETEKSPPTAESETTVNEIEIKEQNENLQTGVPAQNDKPMEIDDSLEAEKDDKDNTTDKEQEEVNETAEEAPKSPEKVLSVGEPMNSTVEKELTEKDASIPASNLDEVSSKNDSSLEEQSEQESKKTKQIDIVEENVEEEKSNKTPCDVHESHEEDSSPTAKNDDEDLQKTAEGVANSKDAEEPPKETNEEVSTANEETEKNEELVEQPKEEKESSQKTPTISDDLSEANKDAAIKTAESVEPSQPAVEGSPKPIEAKQSETEETSDTVNLNDSKEPSTSEAIEKPPAIATDVLEDRVIEVAAFVESTSSGSPVKADVAKPPASQVSEVIEIDDDDDDVPQESNKIPETDKKTENEAPTTEPTENKEADKAVSPMDIDEEPSTQTPTQPAQEQINQAIEKEQESPAVKINYETMKDASPVQVLDDDDDGLLMIDTSHKEENEIENNMDNETATSAPTTDSSSDGSLEVFYDKECVNYECKRGSKNFYRAAGFALSYFKVSKKRSKLQFVCEECYDRALGSYEELCKTLKQKQPLLHGTSFKCQEFVEIIDSSDEEESDAGGDKARDENALPKESIEMLEAELEGAIRKVMTNVDIQNQLSWTKQILQHRLTNLEQDSDLISEQLRSLQRKADNMHNSLYQCPKIKLRQLTPLDLNSGRMYNPEGESSPHKMGPTIPPAGEIIRQPIRVNEQYYAVKTKAIASWVPCKVIEEVDAYPAGFMPTKTYKIKFTKMAKYPMFKTVYAKHMAYYDPPSVRLPIGSRVIAYFDATILSRGKEKMLIPSAFYPGIIAEPLKQSNKFRYLVFYDDGYFQYVNHKDVRLVCQASENVWEDVHHQSREFIHNYLTQYAVNRPMVQTQKGQSMLVDYNGKWIYARVIDVDCSLVQMLFEGQSRSEWIYRGSTRLGPVYKESNNLAQKTNTLNATRRRTEPFIRYINGDDSSSQQAQEQQSEHHPPARTLPAPNSGEIRSVAKKSVSRVDNSNNNNNNNAVQQQQQHPVPTVRHLNNSVIFVDDDNKPKGKVVYYTARKNLPPRNYIPHICNPACPFNITHNLTFYSPLAKPLLSGWERQVFRQKSKKFIVYRGPCGKRLRNIEELHRYLRVTENELNVDNFDFSPETNCLAEYVLEKCLVNKKDISCGKEKMPIPCVNYYDESMPPACEYSAVRIPTEGVPLNLDEEFLCGCDCVDDCSDKTKCACWQLTYAGAKYGMPSVPTEMVGYQYKRLYDHVPTGIYECNSRCKCKANCVNRVVQQPLQSKLQVFKTSNRGWGLRCINDVPRGSFICVYAGQMLTEQVANEGGLDAGDEYFAELDYIEVAEQIKEGYESDVMEPEDEEDMYNPERDDDDDDFRSNAQSMRDKEFNTRSRTRKDNKNSTDGELDSQERQVISFEPNKNMDTSNEPNEKPTIRKLFGKDESCYVMDAKVRGNLGRYFNHSCSPNLFVQNVFVDTHDLRFPWVAFFASTHIRAGTELTWNYNYEVGVVPGKVLYCQCGAPNCRQRLL